MDLPQFKELSKDEEELLALDKKLKEELKELPYYLETPPVRDSEYYKSCIGSSLKAPSNMYIMACTTCGISTPTTTATTTATTITTPAINHHQHGNTKAIERYSDKYKTWTKPKNKSLTTIDTGMFTLLAVTESISKLTINSTCRIVCRFGILPRRVTRRQRPIKENKYVYKSLKKSLSGQCYFA
jgi:hypothetical protein